MSNFCFVNFCGIFLCFAVGLFGHDAASLMLFARLKEFQLFEDLPTQSSIVTLTCLDSQRRTVSLGKEGRICKDPFVRP